MKTLAITLALALCLSGCATIRRHPILASAAVAVVATGIALSTTHAGVERQGWRYDPTCGTECAFMGAPTPTTIGN